MSNGSLFQYKDVFTKEEIESWKSFANSLHVDNRELFQNMLNNYHSYIIAIHANKG